MYNVIIFYVAYSNILTKVRNKKLLLISESIYIYIMYDNYSYYCYISRIVLKKKSETI